MSVVEKVVKRKRIDFPEDANLCEYCTAKCCHYFALAIDEPVNRRDFDFIRWYLLHDGATVFVEGEDWYLLFTRPVSICKPIIGAVSMRLGRKSVEITPPRNVSLRMIGATKSILRHLSRSMSMRTRFSDLNSPSQTARRSIRFVPVDLRACPSR